MSRKSLTVRTIAISATALLALSACSSDSEESVGGMTTCDEATISKAVEDVLAAEAQGEKLFSLDGLECGDGWAVAFPTVGVDEENAITITSVFEAEGQFWVPKDRTAVCGTYDMDNPEAYPSDALIPESLYLAGCQTN
jgi:hypothetical protein